MSSAHSTSTLDTLLFSLAIGDIDILNIDGGCRLSAPQTIHFYAWPIHHTPVIPEILNRASHARIQKVLSEVKRLGVGGLVLVDGGREDPNTTINRPSSANQGNAINIGSTHAAHENLVLIACALNRSYMCSCIIRGSYMSAHVLF